MALYPDALNNKNTELKGIEGKINRLLVLLLLSGFFIGGEVNSQNISIKNYEAWEVFFNEVSLDGTFVLLDLKTGEYSVYNPERAKNRYLPASTFKIMNTLIGLENHTVSDIDEVFRWDGVKRSYDNWNRDLSLREAFRISAVWVYQELARRNGRAVMEEWINKCNYGNMKTGKQIDSFWLDGDIKISAIEQVKFIQLLSEEKLPFSIPVQKQVKEIMLADSSGGKKLYAKTGWAARISHEIGWYVGFVEDADNTWIFALNLDINSADDIRYRVEITRKILDAEGIFPSNE